MTKEITLQKNPSGGELLFCPNCGQKLTAVELVKGDVVLCIKCRRCKEFVKIKITN